MTEAIPQGYKQTEIGVIPEDWEALPLGNLVEIKKGSLITSSTLSKGDIPVIAGGKQPAYYHNMANRFGSCVTISASGANAGFVNFFSEPIFASDCSTIEENKNISLRFIYYQLKLIQNRIYYLQTGGAQPHIHPSDIKPLIFPFPKKQEQIAIATALSETDELIQKLDKLITKKKDIKKGAMQELLTGKKRLPGFSGEWETTSIGNVCTIFGRIGFRGYTVRDIVEEGKGAISLSPSNIIKNKIDYTKCTYLSWKKYDESPEIQIEENDIILVKTASIGKTAIVKNMPEKCTLNPQLVVLKKIKINQRFLGYIMSFPIIQNQISSYLVGGVVPTLSQENIASLKFLYPKDKQEQSAIASILSDMDSEIEELEQKRDKYRMIKEGMMQQLLTGRIRLKWK